MANGWQTPELNAIQQRLALQSIPAAQVAAAAKRSELAQIIEGIAPPPDCTLVAFGSLARGEWTGGSDLDWVLLVDGQVSPAHFDAMLRLRKEFDAVRPGSTGTFGALAFSQDLVHFIGGQDDSNRNLTLRMSLLLESMPIGNGAAYERVVKALLNRYLIQPSSFSREVTPRFLLNDIVRYWRTIGVDYADKFQDQAGEKAVLRNVKLRFSRKLIYSAGLDSCLAWFRRRLESKEGDAKAIIAHFRVMVDTSPLELIASSCSRRRVPEEVFGPLFRSYDRFLEVLSDQGQREELKKLRPVDAMTNALFKEMREAGHIFQDALTRVVALSASDELLQYAIF